MRHTQSILRTIDFRWALSDNRLASLGLKPLCHLKLVVKWFQLVLLQVIVHHLWLSLILLMMTIVLQSRLSALVMRLLKTFCCQMAVMAISDVGTATAFVLRCWLQRYTTANILHCLIYNCLRDASSSSTTLFLIVVQGRVHTTLLTRSHNAIRRIITSTVVLSFLSL